MSWRSVLRFYFARLKPLFYWRTPPLKLAQMSEKDTRIVRQLLRMTYAMKMTNYMQIHVASSRLDDRIIGLWFERTYH